jgi:hypothetical protein
MAGAVPASRGLIQEPRTPLGLVYPVLDQTGTRNIAVLIAQVVRRTQAFRQRQIVLAQFGKHIKWIDVRCVVVAYSLCASDVPNRPSSTHRASGHGERIRHREYLIRVFVK